MSVEWVAFLGAAVGLCLFVYGPSVLRAVRVWWRPEPLAPVSKYQRVRTGL